jgi:hypothetical protein
MPLPPYVISASVFVCRYTLQEPDGVVSAIRIVDVFYVSEKPPEFPESAVPIVQAFACVIIRTVPDHTEEHSLQVKMINTVGEINDLSAPLQVKLAGMVENAPGGATINLQLNIGVKRFGTCYVCVYLDGEEVARAPITLQHKPDEDEAKS